VPGAKELKKIQESRFRGTTVLAGRGEVNFLTVGVGRGRLSGGVPPIFLAVVRTEHWTGLN